ncbi:hypothetical protein Pla175_37070 [Pirellulimonas nuda]|uniref:Uncharacterized protein n=1 Tax=Pirellulimonas nuda TaxID=2528009 RepID=A0A518DFR0_9BACT|nr:hypothetical protein [Pirellulimonas nuda]QDU90304.1 hypothetical protein Pla175_37070 [Pirellulimonas nuda]
MKLWLRRIAIALGLLLLVVGGALVYLHRLATAEVAEYQAVLQADPAALEEGRKELESQSFATFSDAQNPSAWALAVTPDQVNGWLAVRAEDFAPDLKKAGVLDPRVLFDPEVVSVVFRLQTEALDSVVTVRLQPVITTEKEIGIILVGASAGQLPLPTSQIVERLKQATAGLDLPLKWRQDAGRPMLLVDFEQIVSSGHVHREIDAIVVTPEFLRVSGETLVGLPGEVPKDWPAPDETQEPAPTGEGDHPPSE